MQKNDDSFFLLLLTILFLLITCICFFLLRTFTMTSFFVTNAICLEENRYGVIAEKNDAKNIMKQKYFYSRGEKLFYEVGEVTVEKDSMFIVLTVNKRKKKNESLEVSIPVKKETLFTILCKNWRLQ